MDKQAAADGWRWADGEYGSDDSPVFGRLESPQLGRPTWARYSVTVPGSDPEMVAWVERAWDVPAVCAFFARRVSAGLPPIIDGNPVLMSRRLRVELGFGCGGVVVAPVRDSGAVAAGELDPYSVTWSHEHGAYGADGWDAVAYLVSDDAYPADLYPAPPKWATWVVAAPWLPGVLLVQRESDVPDVLAAMASVDSDRGRLPMRECFGAIIEAVRLVAAGAVMAIDGHDIVWGA